GGGDGRGAPERGTLHAGGRAWRIGGTALGQAGPWYLRPGAIEGGAAIPAAGEEHVEDGARGVEDHVGVRVGRPVERGALDGGEGRLALEDDELGGRLAHVDGGHARGQGQGRFHVAAVQQIDGAALRQPR